MARALTALSAVRPAPGRAVLAGAVPAAVLSAVLAGCDTAGAPSVPPPPPVPRATLSFLTDRIELAEGETATFDVRYQGFDLAAEGQFRIAPTEAGWQNDLEVADAVVSVPATGAPGTASVTVTALPDRQFAEGGETWSIGATPEPGGSGIALTAPGTLVVEILDRGVTPCPGVVVRARSWREVDPGAGAWYREAMPETTVTVEVGAAAVDASVHLLGPYFFRSRDEWRPTGALGIGAWTLEPTPDGFRHSIRMNWAGEDFFTEPSTLELAFAGGDCPGTPRATCSSAGCELLGE